MFRQFSLWLRDPDYQMLMFWEWLLGWKIQAQHHLAATSYSEDKGPPIHEPDRNFDHFEYYDPLDFQLDRMCLVLSAYQSVFGFSNSCRSSTGYNQLNMGTSNPIHM